MKSNQPEDEEERRKRIRLERELKRNKRYVNKTDRSFAISEQIIRECILDKGIASHILEQKINNDFIPYLVYENIIKMKSVIMKCIGGYDCEVEAFPGDEPQQPIIDLWANEKVCNEKCNTQHPIQK